MENLPAAQSAQSDDPTTDAYWPAAQLAHASDPADEADFFVTQAVQTLAPTAAYLPARHDEQIAAPVAA